MPLMHLQAHHTHIFTAKIFVMGGGMLPHRQASLPHAAPLLQSSPSCWATISTLLMTKPYTTRHNNLSSAALLLCSLTRGNPRHCTQQQVSSVQATVQPAIMYAGYSCGLVGEFDLRQPGAARDAGKDAEAEQLAAQVSAYNAAQPGVVRPLHQQHLNLQLLTPDSICGVYCADGSACYCYHAPSNASRLTVAISEGKNPALLEAIRGVLGYGSIGADAAPADLLQRAGHAGVW